MSASSVGSVIETEKLMESAEALPALPLSAIRLTGLLSDPQVDISDIVETVSFDPALTAAVLRQANSAASGGRAHIGTVRDAVVRLGTNTVVSVALASHLSKQMMRPVTEYGLTDGELWRQSVLSSLAAEMIRSTSPVTIPAEVVTAALLHDIGKVVLSNYRTKPVLDFIAKAQAMEAVDDYEAELAILEVHHGEVGALVAQNWRLPESIVMAVQYHHTPAEQPEPICYAVFVADKIADYLLSEDGVAFIEGRGDEVELTDDLGLDGPVRDTFVHSLGELRIPPEKMRKLVEQTASRFGRVSKLYLIED